MFSSPFSPRYHLVSQVQYTWHVSQQFILECGIILLLLFTFKIHYIDIIVNKYLKRVERFCLEFYYRGYIIYPIMGQGDKRKTDLYKWIKIGGLLSFLPFVLAAGPIAGFFLGSWLEKKFSLPAYVSIVFITIGFAASLRETIRIVKLALKTQEKA